MAGIARIPVPVDGPTIRLRHLAAACAAQGNLAAASTKRLTGLVRAVRGYAEAYEPGLALGALLEIEAFADDLDKAEEEPLLAAALRKHSAVVRTAVSGM